MFCFCVFFFQAEDGIRDVAVTGVQTCALPILYLIIICAFPVFATNGDNLIGIGPSSRAMGGVGIAAPMDAISAVFANPAAMSFGDYGPSSEMNFAGTLFMPKDKAKRTNIGGIIQSDSDENIYAIPA